MCERLCDYDIACSAELPPVKGRVLTVLLLYCWQREYDKRPYRSFQFRKLEFEERMKRNYHCIRDLHVIVNFLLQRQLLSVSIWSIPVSNWDVSLLKDFVKSLLPVPRIELKLMRLPEEFFVLLRLKAKEMQVSDLSLEGTSLSDEAVSMLREFLLVCPTLHTLNVSSCGLTQYNFATLADGVHKSSSMRNLCASRLLGLTLSLDSEKIASVVGSLLMQNKLVELTMQNCEFTAQDMETVAEYLGIRNSVLRRLSLAYNNIAADGAMFLMRGVVQGEALELLDIRGNNIGTHGGEWVAMHFSSCLMLQHLYLDDNRIGAEAVNLILLTLKKPCRLKRLQLCENFFDARSAMILRRLLDAKVLRQEEIDISYTYDEALEDYRVVPWR
ncbi:hypothetical protein KR222_001698 [Zaprionus bogoriensis]|nr:hypothetical protein KR222_001698 [Zaprionus bogoriensis]